MKRDIVPIQRMRNVSKADFDALLLRDEPAILEGEIDDWPACTLWSPDRLVQKIGDLKIRVRTSSSHCHPDLATLQAQWDRPFVSRVMEGLRRRIRGTARKDDGRMPFAEFVHLLTHSPQAFRYLAGAEELALCTAGRWNEELSVLREDTEVPRLVPRLQLDSAAVWMSAQGVRSHLHYDGDGLHNLNAQVLGSKQVLMYSPAQMASLYPYLLSNNRPPNFSQVDVERVDHARFPLFADADAYEGTLNRGDLLLIPAYWYHTFKHLSEFNVNVNFWWKANFVRLTPVSAREYFGRMSFATFKEARIPPVWLYGWLRRMERRVTQDDSRQG